MTTITKNTFDPKKIEEQRFEFVLRINNHIICQRYFNIRDFDDDQIIGLYEMKDLMDNICGMNNGQFGSLGIIPRFLKEKSVDYLWSNYNPYFSNSETNNKSNSDRIDNFQFEIRIDKRTVSQSIFSGNAFPPKVRYAVDIKEIIPNIINEIREQLSRK